ncbi:MAG: 4-hydroxy-3-methylbut-2-enyl diphosphate reductase [Bacteroidales bacterium]|nr:4-hydroxy-3-methylbut-2-enyl diphosphate reductase [Bacteroidales bacterium]
MSRVAEIKIDEQSGFCFGVINAIKTAEEWLAKEGSLYCLGDLVHNSEEMQRLTDLGLQVITHEELRELHHVRVLIRAHGEPPETYRIAQENNIEIIDATCKVVLHLQQTIRRCFEDASSDFGQILIFGKKGHAEVVGLLGQTRQQGIVISSPEDIDKIDFSKPAWLFSQTTQNTDEYQQIVTAIRKKYNDFGNAHLFEYSDTICHSVVNRSRQIEQFARQFDTILFVSGEKSSNGLYLFEICKKNNPNSFFITRLEQLPSLQFSPSDHIGICGATSTPMWLMQKVRDYLISM